MKPTTHGAERRITRPVTAAHGISSVSVLRAAEPPLRVALLYRLPHTVRREVGTVVFFLPRSILGIPHVWQAQHLARSPQGLECSQRVMKNPPLERRVAGFPGFVIQGEVKEYGPWWPDRQRHVPSRTHA